jgi:uncharacterized SAM-binding protein YcdF (DUF218 family)
MIYLHKILPIFLSPLVIVFALLAYGVFRRRFAWIISGMVLLYLCSAPIIAEALFAKIEKSTTRLSPMDLPDAEAIVVLSAGMTWIKTKNGFASEWATASRFFGGVELYKASKAPRLVFTGGKLPWQQGHETEGEVLKRHAEWMQVPVDRILVTEIAENTEQEALGLRKLLGEGKRTIILVTSAFHMERAKKIFESVGFEVFPYPVNILVAAEDLTVMKFFPDPRALSTTHTAVRELLGRLYYQIRHH